MVWDGMDRNGKLSGELLTTKGDAGCVKNKDVSLTGSKAELLTRSLQAHVGVSHNERSKPVLGDSIYLPV